MWVLKLRVGKCEWDYLTVRVDKPMVELEVDEIDEVDQ